MLTYPDYKIITTKRDDGSIIIKSSLKIENINKNYGSQFISICNKFPDNIWLAEKHGGDWNKLNYKDALQNILSIGQALLDLGLNQNKGVMILSGNSIKHAVLTVAAMSVGIPVSPISVAYSTMSKDFSKLNHCYRTIEPGLVFAEDENVFEKAIKHLDLKSTKLLLAKKSSLFNNSISFLKLLKTTPKSNLLDIIKNIESKDVAKYLFTSGSTGMPKAVINTHQMLCTNIEQAIKVMAKENLKDTTLLDWLPWNHTMGGNHIFNLVVWRGGTLYIDNGKPIPGLFEKTINNLKELSPTSYVSVPAGLIMLLNHLKSDKDLRTSFFKNLVSIHYGGASLPPEVWYGIKKLSKETYDKEIYLACGWGSTETAPVSTQTYFHLDRPGNIGLPLPEVEIKMVPNGTKMELRVRGPNVTPGYHKRPDLTS